MSQEVARRTPQQELIARVRSEEFMQQAGMALQGTGVHPQRFVRAAVTALAQNPSIAGADPNSVFMSLLRAAQDGLLPDGYEAALVMFKDKAQYLPMIGGIRKIAGEHGWAIRTNIVYANDAFEYELGLEPTIKHVPVRPGHDPGNPIAAYAVGAHTDGRREIEVMTEAEIEKVRQVSRAKDKGPWVDWPQAMWEKTVGKRLFKKLPLGGDQRALRIMALDDLENGEAAEKLYDIQVPAPSYAPRAPEPDAGVHPPVEAEGGGAGDDIMGGVAPDPPDDEPATGTLFVPPEGAVEEASFDQQMGEAAGMDIIVNGKHKGKTIAQVAAEDGGVGWLTWLLARDSHPNLSAARTYCRAFYPELLDLRASDLTKGADEWKAQ